MKLISVELLSFLYVAFIMLHFKFCLKV